MLNVWVGLGVIAQWEFEPETFWFEKIRRGVRSYTPDFRVTMRDGTIQFVEVKGWMDKKSATKLKRMRKYHPTVDILLVDKNEYARLRSLWKASVPEWEGP